MYDWLAAVAREPAHVLTASRRLARTLRHEFASQQASTGKTAWRMPDIDEWRDWAFSQASMHGEPSSLPVLISAYQSKFLWERCLRRESRDPLLNVSVLARQARETWLRLQEWRVPIEECQRRAQNKDQWLFAKAAVAYQSILDAEGWTDESGVADLAIGLLQSGEIPANTALLMAGFDRITPKTLQLVDAYRAAGGRVEIRKPADTAGPAGNKCIAALKDGDTELRVAGKWARDILRDKPDARLAVVVTQLEKDARRSERLLKEGLMPGWQCASTEDTSAINISYGRKLVEYPAVTAALVALEWLIKDLSTTQVSGLLRSALFAEPTAGERIRAELTLRQLPEQNWSAVGLLRTLRQGRTQTTASDSGLGFIATIADYSRGLPRRQPPSAWVTLFSELLEAIGWPGATTLGSAEFQTINRWRELLNEVARLELISNSMTIAEVYAHLAALASDTLFQPESKTAAVNVLGPLEAAGLEFDAVWITGASNADWPPRTHSPALVARDLQRDYGLPDAVPADTVQYAQRVIDRLAAAAPEVVFSYALIQTDAHQAASALLEKHALRAAEGFADPGWNAARLLGAGQVVIIDDDPVPPVTRDEQVRGGAATIQRQFSEPFGAFVSGRLGVQLLWPIEPGLAPNIRGSLIHDALQRLYAECPTQAQIQAWSATETEERIGQATGHVFKRYEVHADAILAQLLLLEKKRAERLLQSVVVHDRSRETFRIAAVEDALQARIRGLNLKLRMDRIDIDAAGQYIVIDYKTGSVKRLLDRDQQPKDMQLVVYARALDGETAGFALLNIDSRAISFDLAGRNVSPKLDWDAMLPVWFAEVDAAAGQIAHGDVRINLAQAIKESRRFGLLSRFRELQHAD